MNLSGLNETGCLIEVTGYEINLAMIGSRIRPVPQLDVPSWQLTSGQKRNVRHSFQQ
jgi:hypothetical protein